MKNTVVLLSSLAFYLLTAFGISLTITAAVGVSSFNSLNLSLAYLTDLKIGTITIIVNAIFLLFYIYLTDFKLIRTYLLQSVAVLAFGQVINFFAYYLVDRLVVTNYFLQLALFILGLVIAGFGTGMVLNLKLLTFPIEGVCLVLAEKTRLTFKQFRYGIDFFSVSFSLIVTLVTPAPLFVREGTLISLFLLSYFINITKKEFEKMYHQA